MKSCRQSENKAAYMFVQGKSLQERVCNWLVGFEAKKPKLVNFKPHAILMYKKMSVYYVPLSWQAKNIDCQCKVWSTH